MRRSSLLKYLLAFALVSISVVAGVFDRVDYTPYRQWTTYQDMLRAIDKGSADLEISRGPLHAGFGRTSLTPRLGSIDEDWQSGSFKELPLAGFSARLGATAMGVHDPLWVKSMALRSGEEVVVLVTLDLLMVPPSVSKIVVERLPDLGLRRAQLYLSATHTHSGPGGWGRELAIQLVAGFYNQGVEQWIAQQILSSIETALADLQPASMTAAWVDIPELVRNRTSPSAPVHGGFSVIAVKQRAGATAAMGSYAAHPVVLPAANLELSGDYPGAWQRRMEERGFEMAMFMAGPMGGQTAARRAETFEEAERFGETLAERVSKVISDAHFRTEVELGALGLELALPAPQVRLAENWRLRAWAARTLLPLPETTFLQAVRIGDSVLISTPADYAGELALPAEGRLRDLGFIAFITGFNGDYIGYVMPSKYDRLDSYETRDLSFYGPGMGDYTSEAIDRLADALIAPAGLAAPSRSVSDAGSNGEVLPNTVQD